MNQMSAGHASKPHLFWLVILLLLVSCQAAPSPAATVSPVTTEAVTPSPAASFTPGKTETVTPGATDTVIPATEPAQPTQATVTPTIESQPTEAQPDCETACYYFDSVNGSDSNSGRSPDQPWQSLQKINDTGYLPGDTVYFKRGSTWTGGMIIDDSGTTDEPILFTAYGEEGDPPLFRNPDATERSQSPAIIIRSDWVVLENVKVVDAILAGVYIAKGGDYNVVRDIEATQVGEGVNVHGQFNKILNNYIHDLVMVVNTEGGTDDYGAVGIWLFNSDNEVAFNRLINCKAPSYDFGFDGGAVEFYLDVHRSYIHHNYSYNTQGFTEIGGGDAYDNVIAYNLMVESGRPLGMHLGGERNGEIKNLVFENNTVIDTNPEGFYGAILFLNTEPVEGTLVMRNNIFYLPYFDHLTNIEDPIFVHENNLYYLPQATLRLTPNASEIIGDPKFVDLAAGDFRLQAGSPAIDRGLNLGYLLDYDLLKVPSGAAPDIGAYEYQQ